MIKSTLRVTGMTGAILLLSCTCSLGPMIHSATETSAPEPTKLPTKSQVWVTLEIVSFQYDGVWSGTTGQDFPISFTIEYGYFVDAYLKLQKEKCSIESTGIMNFFELKGDKFDFSINEIEIKGEFVSKTSASGTLAYESYGLIAI
jgi:hypothetical protein